MASYNKVFLLGNLTRDPEVRYTPKGSAVADLGIAVNRQYTLDTGEKREEVTFVDVTFWGRTAEVAGEYLKKGPLGFHRRPAPARYLGRQAIRTKTEQAQGDRRGDADARWPARRKQWRRRTGRSATRPCERRRAERGSSQRRGPGRAGRRRDSVLGKS